MIIACRSINPKTEMDFTEANKGNKEAKRSQSSGVVTNWLPILNLLSQRKPSHPIEGLLVVVPFSSWIQERTPRTLCAHSALGSECARHRAQERTKGRGLWSIPALPGSRTLLRPRTGALRAGRIVLRLTGIRATGFARWSSGRQKADCRCSFSWGRLEPLGKRRKEFAGGEGPTGPRERRERVNVRMRAGVETILIRVGFLRRPQPLLTPGRQGAETQRAFQFALRLGAFGLVILDSVTLFSFS